MANYPVSVAFEGEECGFNLTAILLSKIEVTKNPNKRSYQPGEVLNYSGIVVTATYDDQTTANVTSRCIFTPAAGEAFESPVEIVYAEGQDEKSCSLTLAEVSPLRIYISSQPTKTVYHSGETIDYTGLVVKAVYSDDSEIDVTNRCSYSSESGQPFDPDNDTSIEISYLDCSTTLSLTAIILTGISVTSNPTKTAYRSGEAIDYTGLVVTASYSDGSTVNVTSNCTITPRTGKLFDPETDTNVEISYLDSSESATASLVLTAITLTGISVTTNPTKMSYEAGEVIDYSGLVVTASYSDSSTAIVTNSCTITPRAGKVFDPDTDSSAEISYIENGQEFTANLMLTDVYLTGLQVTTNPTKTAYKHDERISYSGMVVTASYSDGTTEDVTSECSITPANNKQFDAEEDTYVTITYREISCMLTLTPILATVLQITTNPHKTTYSTGEAIDYSGIVVTATYSDGSTDNVTAKCTFSPSSGKSFDSSTDTMVTITYTEGNSELTCTLTLSEVSMRLYVYTMPTKVIYQPGALADYTGAVITAVQANGDGAYVTDYCDFNPAEGTQINEETEVVVSCSLPATPYVFDQNSGYVDNGVWKVETPTNTYIDIYRVTAGHKYLLTLGADVGSRFRTMFTTQDVSTATANVTGTVIINQNNPETFASVEYTPSSNGYIVVGKDNVGKSGIKTYLYDRYASIKQVTTTFTLTMAELVSITVTNPTKTNYSAGEMYDYTGAVVTATYEDGSTKDVTEASTFNPVEGTIAYESDVPVAITIFVSYEGQQADFRIIIGNLLYTMSENYQFPCFYTLVLRTYSVHRWAYRWQNDNSFYYESLYAGWLGAYPIYVDKYFTHDSDISSYIVHLYFFYFDHKNSEPKSFVIDVGPERRRDENGVMHEYYYRDCFLHNGKIRLPVQDYADGQRTVSYLDIEPPETFPDSAILWELAYTSSDDVLVANSNDTYDERLTPIYTTISKGTTHDKFSGTIDLIRAGIPNAIDGRVEQESGTIYDNYCVFCDPSSLTHGIYTRLLLIAYNSSAKKHVVNIVEIDLS